MLAQNGLLPESLIWTYVIQLTSAIRYGQLHIQTGVTKYALKGLIVELISNC